MTTEQINQLAKTFEKFSPQEILSYFLIEFKGKIALSTSFSIEDQVLTDMIMKISPDCCIFTLDTGRNFPETYEVLEQTSKKYNKFIEVTFPNAAETEAMVNERGINLFYNSVENRKLCCNIRKIKPLKKKLSSMQVWITGIRWEQSITRIATKVVEYDNDLSIIKINPILQWLEKDVWNYIKENKVPYNTLYDKGYKSIGCQPCTRAVKPGEEIRAGRWWWETPESKECGLHTKKK